MEKIKTEKYEETDRSPNGRIVMYTYRRANIPIDKEL